MYLSPLSPPFIKSSVVLLLCFFSIKPQAQIRAFFNSDKEGGCPPFTVQFTNLSEGVSPNAVYKWDFGNGNSSSLANPAAVFTEDKTYTVTLSITDGDKTSNHTQQITGYKKPVAAFKTTNDKGCIPASIEFVSNSSPGSGELERYYWDFGDGSTEESNSNTIVHTYNMLLKPTVNLTVFNNYGCYTTIEKKDVAQILPSIEASFVSSKQVLCKETDPVQFTSTSSGPGTLSWLWDFGDGKTSTTQHPSHVFNKKGIYTVSLTVKNTEGCSITSTQTDYLNVASYKADFSAPTLICENQHVGFSSTSTPSANSYNWYLNNDLVETWNPEFAYYFANTGKYTIKLEATFGDCKDANIKTVEVKSTPRADFTADIQNPCGAPSLVKFTDKTPGAVQWNWDFYSDMNGPKSTLQSPGFTYTNEGTYYVNLTATNRDGCSSTAAQPINIGKPWVHIGNKLSEYENFSCGYLKAQMFATYYSEEILTYKWNLGDGTSSTQPEPIHEYTRPGVFNVSLEYQLKNGCKGTSTSMALVVYAKPKADFSVSNALICGNTPVTYVYTGGSAFTNITWDLEGDYNYLPYTGRVDQQAVQYNAEGVYGAAITVYNGNCVDTLSKKNFVTVKLPFPRITGFDRTCEGSRGKVTFTQNSVGATSIIWDFGDGKTQTAAPGLPNVEHDFTRTGTYKVVLTAINAECRVRDSIWVQVLLKQKPTLNVTPTIVCTGTPIEYLTANYEKNPMVDVYDGYSIKKWEYEDGTEFNGTYTRDWGDRFYTWEREARGKLLPQQPKDSRLRLITTSTHFDCEDTTNFVVIQFKGANAAFDVVTDKVCFNTDEVRLRDASTASNNTIRQWLWDFGDGQTELSNTNTVVSHRYQHPGIYNVSLTITDAGGCSSSTGTASKQVEVFGPEAAFYMSHGNEVPLNTTVSFINNTNIYGVDAIEYRWDFGDGSSASSEASPDHNYPRPGTYVITLRATNRATGCTSEMTQTLVVRNFNSAFQFTKFFITNSQCAPAVVNFQNTSYDYTRIVWDFGDDSQLLENVNTPNHVYKEAGKYTVKLLVYGYNGLTGEYIDTIYINKPSATLKVAPSEVCVGSEVQLKGSGQKIAQYVYDLGDGNVSVVTDSLLNYIYASPGRYQPQLLISDINGCTVAAEAKDRLNVRPQPTLSILPDQPKVCAGQSLQLNAQSTGGTQFQWKPANGISDLQIAKPFVRPTVTTTYEVEVKDEIGCSATASQTVLVVLPEPMRVQADTGICRGEKITLTVSGSSRYTWIHNTTGLSATNIPNPIVSPQNSAVYTVVGSDSNGCFPDTANIRIDVYDLPTVAAPPDAEIIAGIPLLLSTTGSQDIVSWHWSPATALNCTNCPSPETKAVANTTYTVLVSNVNGCTAKDEVKIKMQCDAAKVHIPNAFTPNGDGLNDVFTVLGISYVKHMAIYNRFGKIVYERRDFRASDKSLGWDGTLNGIQLQTDSYVYFVEMECSDGGYFTRKGTVTLIR